MDNPLLAPARLPAFDLIRPEHYLPALDVALQEMQATVASIKADPAPPTFRNTVLPLDSLFEKAGYIDGLLSNRVASAHTDALSAIKEQFDIRMSDAAKTVFQDPALGARFHAVYAERDKLNLDADDTAVLEGMFASFRDSGALLPPEGQKKLRALDARLIELGRQFNDNLKEAAEQQAVLVTDGAELAGLSAEEIESFADAAREKGQEGWRVTPERLMVDDLLEKAAHPAFRRRIFEALDRMGTEAPFDNRPVIAEMLEKRDEAAKLLGYPNYAEWARVAKMAPGVDAAKKLLNDTAEKVLPVFEADMRALEIFAQQEQGQAQPVALEPWDVPYWAARQREKVYGFDAGAFSKHLALENVLKGMFSEAQLMHGVNFREVQGHATLHPDIRVFEVTDDKGAEVGFLHLDVFARPGTKDGGAWMSELQGKSDGHPPVVMLSLNVNKPPAGAPALLGLSQVETAYHEMGHGLHGLLGTDVKHKSLQGTAGDADYTEIFSTLNESRPYLERNLRAFALHADTGLPPPDAVIGTLLKSKSHFMAAQTLRMVQNSLRDLEFHSIRPEDYRGDAALEAQAALKTPYAAHLRPYPLARFAHLFDDGHAPYAASYVDYVVAQVHALDALTPLAADPYDPTALKRLSGLYRRGSGGDAAALYEEYLGRKATPDALLREMGIAPGKAPAAPTGTPPASRPATG